MSTHAQRALDEHSPVDQGPDESCQEKMDYARYIDLALRNRRLLILGGIAGVIAGLSSGFGAPFFVERVFRSIFEDTTTTYTFSYLAFVALLLPAVFLIRGVANYLNQYLLQWVVQNVLKDIRRQLFEKLQSLPVAYFERRQSGDLMAKVVSDTLLIQEPILHVARDSFSQPITFLAGLGYLAYLSFEQRQIGFLLLMIILTPIMTLPVRYIGRHLRHRSRDLQHTLGELSNIVAEDLRGVVEVRSFSLQQRELDRFGAKLNMSHRCAMKMTKYYHLTQPLMEMLAVIMVSAAFLYCYQNGIGFSAFAAMGTALFFTIDSLKRVARMFNGLQKARGSFDRIETVLSEKETLPDPEEPVVLTNPVGHLRIEDLRFSYTGSSEAHDLEVSSLEIPFGTTCILAGSSGAGKSTFVKLVQRFYDPHEGRILFDDVDIRSVNQNHLREQIAFVPQDPVLFSGTIRENLLLARPDASEDKLVHAARLAHAEEFILSLHDGYDALVGENAVRLSGGQRQRLALARAFLKNAPILILDEATSALDSENTEKIIESLANLAGDRTLIIVAHSIATHHLADQILLFENGRIRCQGDRATLIQDDLFRRLYDVRMTQDDARTGNRSS